jgi:hypothetical protein
MAVIQALFALITRSLGRITSSIFGWAVVALFGRTNSREQTLLSALVGAAAAWPVLLLGIVMPKIRTFLISFVPIPEWIPDWTVRAMDRPGIFSSTRTSSTLRLVSLTNSCGRQSLMIRLASFLPHRSGLSLALAVQYAIRS